MLIPQKPGQCDRPADYTRNHKQTCISSVEDSEIHINAGDFNGHVGKEIVTFDTSHGFSVLSATELAVSNTFFLIQKSKQTDHILFS